MAKIDEKIGGWLDGITNVDAVEPQNRHERNGYLEVVYMRTGIAYTPTHDCDTLNDGLWIAEFVGQDYGNLVTAVDEAQKDLKAGSGAFTHADLKIHLPDDREGKRYSLTETDTSEVTERITFRVIT